MGRAGVRVMMVDIVLVRKFLFALMACLFGGRLSTRLSVLRMVSFIITGIAGGAL